MSGVNWEDPPAEALAYRHRAGTLGAWLEAIKAKPGVWARYERTYATEESAKAAAGSIKRGDVKGVDKGEYEVVTFAENLWARYVKGVNVTSLDPTPEPSNYQTELRRMYAVKVRAWAKRGGIKVPDGGRIPERVLRQYEEATGDLRPRPRASSPGDPGAPEG